MSTPQNEILLLLCHQDEYLITIAYIMSLIKQ